MAKKAELLEKAAKLRVKVGPGHTIAQIEAAIAKVLDEATNATSELIDEVSESTAEVITEAKEGFAKAGKRSEKALHETEEKIEKEARKASHDTAPQSAEAEAHVKRGAAPVTRPKTERHGKKFKEAAKRVEPGKVYNLAEAIQLVSETSPVKFDATVEVHVVLGVDPRQADQNIRSTVTLPHGTGKTVRVAAFVPIDEIEAAKTAGADIIGEEEITKQLDKEQINFDVLVATPQLMPKLGKYARLLGPRGLMPNPKSGTVATNVAKAVSEAKGGKVEYRVDKQAIVHLGIGKISFGASKLLDNAKVFFESIHSVKPSSLKGTYIQTVHVSSTMGPGVKIDNTSL